MTARKTATSTSARMGAIALVAALALAGCGEGEDDPQGSATDTGAPTQAPPTETAPTETTPTETTPAEPTEPVCSSVWVAGSVLPEDYQGCFDDAKQKWIESMPYPCSSGQELVTHQRNFYAAVGEKVVETKVPLARDKAFKKVMATCGA